MPPVDVEALARDHAVLAARIGDFTRLQDAFNQEAKNDHEKVERLFTRQTRTEGRLDQIEGKNQARSDRTWQIWTIVIAATLAIVSGVLTARFS